MYEILRKHIQDFGFNHSEISRRSTNLNQATAYRVVEGETQNPSIGSITSIIEVINDLMCANEQVVSPYLLKGLFPKGREFPG